MKQNSIFQILWFSHFLLNISITIFFLFPLQIEKLGGSRADIGLIMGIALGAGVVVRPLISFLIDHKGRKLLFMLGGVMNVFACFLYLQIHSLGVLLYLVRIIHGGGLGILFATYFTVAADISPPARRVHLIGIFGISGLLPMALGPIVGEFLLAHSSFSHLYFSSGLTALAAFILTFFVPETSPLLEDKQSIIQKKTIKRQRKLNLRFIVSRDLLPVWFGAFFFGAVINACFIFMAPFFRELNLHNITPFFGAYVITSTLTRLFFGTFPERIGTSRIYFPASFSLFIGLIITGFSSTNTHFIIAGFFIGIGHAYLFPLLLGLATQRSPLENRGGSIVIATTMMDLGGLICGPIFGLIADSSDYKMLFLTAGMLALIQGIVFLLSIKKQNG